MIRQLQNAELPAFLDTVRKDYMQNPYIYIDALTLGLESVQTSAWIVEDVCFLGYVFRYYHSIQLFSCPEPEYADTFADEAAAFLARADYDMISGDAACLRRVNRQLREYKFTEGVIMSLREASPKEAGIETAGPSDCDEIAALICSDASIGGHYQTKALSLQLQGRMLHENCRNLVIRKDGRIAAHFGTYAETDEFAILGGLITAPDYRGKGFGATLQAQLASLLLREGKHPLLYCFQKNTQAWYARYGWQPVRRCAKLERIKG